MRDRRSVHYRASRRNEAGCPWHRERRPVVGTADLSAQGAGRRSSAQQPLTCTTSPPTTGTGREKLGLSVTNVWYSPFSPHGSTPISTSFWTVSREISIPSHDASSHLA